jgi:shikimate dehydrogenase
MKVKIRKATVMDYNDLCELFEEVDALHRDHHPGIFKKPEGPGRELAYYSSLLADEMIGFFVAELDGELAGFVNGMLKDTPAIPLLVPRRYAVVDTICVRTGIQGQGIGHTLMDTLQGWAISNGAESIELHVYEFNLTAITFYQGLGFETLSRKMSKMLAGK